MKISYVKTKVDIYKEKVAIYKLNEEFYRGKSPLNILAYNINKVKFILERKQKEIGEIELLENEISIKVKNLDTRIINYKDISYISEFNDIIFIYEKELITIHYKSFSNIDERLEFLALLKSSCNIENNEDRKKQGIGFINNDKSLVDLSQDEKEHLVFSDSRPDMHQAGIYCNNR